MGDDEKLVKSMEFCQSTISRMAKNSFQLKAWFLVAFTAVFTFYSKSITGENGYTLSLYDLLWILPMLIFTFLDAFYLQQERMFVGVYSDFAKKVSGGDNPRKPFDMKPTQEQRKKFSILNCVFSISVGWLYFPLILTFQFLIITQVYSGRKILVGLILPALISVMALIFKKKTDHKKTER